MAVLFIGRLSATGDIANRGTAVCARRGTCITILVYNGDMPASNKVVRQTVGLPADTARHVRSLAKQRRLSANRIIVELVEEGIEAQKRKQREFFELAERYRAATDPKDVARLGDDLGRMVFGD
jgi:hypothetical protein